ncbi:MAG: ABC transporter ATP-binding protein [Parachlamydiaceae bacterium]|nr:ABC transporter ATP-binding protein [Parachlamydiaceae bacterium]
MPQDSRKIVLDIRAISKTYQMGHGMVSALKHIDLQVLKGESIAIMGPSGSGKSTLMHLLGCLDKPSTGTYCLNGQNIAELDDNALSLIRATQIGFVFQSFNLIAQLNVIENVEIPFLYRNDKKKNPRECSINAIQRVGLGHRLYHLPSQLSGGEMQRVAIARALAIDPLLILADEPTGNLDFETGESILKLFQELNSQGVTLMMITHDESVGKHCQRLIRMRDGKIVSEEKK